jgi:hypothetical protein
MNCDNGYRNEYQPSKSPVSLQLKAPGKPSPCKAFIHNFANEAHPNRKFTFSHLYNNSMCCCMQENMNSNHIKVTWASKQDQPQTYIQHIISFKNSNEIQNLLTFLLSTAIKPQQSVTKCYAHQELLLLFFCIATIFVTQFHSGIKGNHSLVE